MPIPARRVATPGLALLFLIGACARQDPQPKIPLRNVAAGQEATNPHDALSERARAALERGNDDYRAARYEAALDAYSSASREAPASAAPYYGILMAAQKLGNARLADSASTMIRRLSGDASQLTDIHGADGSGAKR